MTVLHINDKLNGRKDSPVKGRKDSPVKGRKDSPVKGRKDSPEGYPTGLNSYLAIVKSENNDSSRYK